MTLPDIHRELHLSGYSIKSRDPVKRLADCLAYESDQGRARHVDRGTYALGQLNPAARRRIDGIALDASRLIDSDRLVRRFGRELDAVASPRSRFVERSARLMHELGGTQRVRRVTRHSRRQRQRIANR